MAQLKKWGNSCCFLLDNGALIGYNIELELAQG
jgi:hypothetical protein